jgi:DNA replication protein DnaC
MSELRVRNLLSDLRMPGAVVAYDQQLTSPSFSEMPFDERMEHILVSEVYSRDERTRQRLLRRAKLKHKADPNELIFSAERGIEKSYIAELLTCRWVRHADNVLISGAAGTGKTWLACALAMAAINLGMSVRYVRTNPMLEEMGLAHLDGSVSKLRHSLVACSLLILDDFGIAGVSEQAKEDLLEILDGRIDKCATIVIAQLDPSEWHSYLDSPHLADAIMDRLVQRSHKLPLRGGSMRQRKASSHPIPD